MAAYPLHLVEEYESPLPEDGDVLRRGASDELLHPGAGPVVAGVDLEEVEAELLGEDVDAARLPRAGWAVEEDGALLRDPLLPAAEPEPELVDRLPVVGYVRDGAWPEPDRPG